MEIFQYLNIKFSGNIPAFQRKWATTSPTPYSYGQTDNLYYNYTKNSTGNRLNDVDDSADKNRAF